MTSPSPRHSHDFGQDRRLPGERRTVVVAAITTLTMAVEIAAGLAFGSMALLADGLHMGSHAAALGIAVFAYVYARRHARDPRFNFGTGKVNALGGFTGAVLLALFALLMAWESAKRLLFPVSIAFDKAILVAVVGLLVNGVSVVILGRGDGHSHGHPHEHEHDHHHHHHDHNLRSAYLHVLADALTSVFAILALLSGKYLGWSWMDPVMGVIGAVMVAVWSRGLLLATARVLLDMRVSDELLDRLREHLEADPDTRVTDLHVWEVGPGRHAAMASLAAAVPRAASHYHALIPPGLGIVHATIEVDAAGG
ncbi:MAG: CDF family Co(II)/Ni(II) efflux transporter DmeF [Candidatus Hydrogenedentes bacterium]|nr:CDF family Co(II)/Ni(II) efflux transporter DmeF [Candidatus Hydrogenedentota bacterium]